MRVLILLLLFTLEIFAHDLTHTRSNTQSITVAFSFSSQVDFAYKNYEIFAPDTTIPFAVGRTDALSRVTFVPNQTGEWKLKVFSEDGHGKVVTIDVREDMSTTKQTQTPKWLKIYSGMLSIFFIFALLFIYKQRKIR